MRLTSLSWLLLASFAKCGAARGGGGLAAWEDDVDTAVRALRARLANPMNGSSGIVMLVDPRHRELADVTVPIWRKYCERHGYGFFLQRESLNMNASFEWSKPRLLMEILASAKAWRYVFVVDPTSIPVDFSRSFDFILKTHMRQKRYVNDDTKRRRIFCPADCEEDYENAFEEGACYGPMLSGCIFQASKAGTQELVRLWYSKRYDGNPLGSALDRVKDHRHDQIYFKDVSTDIGRQRSRFMLTFGFDDKYGWNVLEQVLAYLKEHPKVAQLARTARSEWPETREAWQLGAEL